MLLLITVVRVLLYAKTLKETATEETIGFVIIILVIGGISIGKRRAPDPPGNAYS